MSGTVDQRMNELGITLPAPPKPLGAYVETVQVGSLLFLSGALPVEGGAPKFTGRLGDDIDVQQGREAAKLAVLNALALARQSLGSLDAVARVVRLKVSLATTPEFRDHAKVADGASEVLAGIFGKEKTSTRMVAGVVSLPAGVCAVVELVLAIG